MQHRRVWPNGLPMLPILVLFLGSLLFSAGLALYLTRPIKHLRNATQRCASGELTSRVLPELSGRKDELVDLAADFDDMASQLSALIDGQQRLLSDVSHELRSPLARLQLAIALGQQQPEQLIVMMARIEKESQRLDNLIGELLTLSRIESDTLLMQSDQLDLIALLREISLDANFEAEQQAKQVQVDTAIDTLIVSGNTELLRRAFENIIRNGVFYTREQTVVTVAATYDDKTVTVTVCDQGEGVDEAALAELFLPFVRLSQHQNNIVPGYGLGLATAARAIALHQGEISAHNSVEGGLCVVVCLPR